MGASEAHRGDASHFISGCNSVVWDSVMNAFSSKTAANSAFGCLEKLFEGAQKAGSVVPSSLAHSLVKHLQELHILQLCPISAPAI